MEKEQVIFSFEIIGVDTPSGVDFKIRLYNKGVPDDTVITKMRMWLKGAEQNYFNEFKKDFSL